MQDYSVLSAGVDPYRQGAPAQDQRGRWLKAQMVHLGQTTPIHTRGLFYKMVGNCLLPDGSPFTNSYANWSVLSKAANSARWLGYISFDILIDERNDEPFYYEHEDSQHSWGHLLGGIYGLHEVSCDKAYASATVARAKQPYHLVMIGEKTSLRAILEPLAYRYEADLYLPTGEISNTLLYDIARRGQQDGRKLIVFGFYDFDPAGHQMAISVGRKLQAFRDLLFPDLEYRVIHVALTEEQVREYDLPSAPLSPKEKRADKWKAGHHGLEQTELDALIFRHPGALRRIATEALDPFFDDTLADRTREVEREYIDLINSNLEASGYDRTEEARLLDEAREKLAEIEAINDQLRELRRVVTLPPAPPSPEPEVDPPSDDGVLTDSDWSFIEQSQVMKRYKAYDYGDKDEDGDED